VWTVAGGLSAHGAPRPSTVTAPTSGGRAAIRDLKEGAGLAHCPSGKFNANAAWLVLAALAHNTLRWTARLDAITDGIVVAKTLRRRLIAAPGRLTRTARRQTLHLPTRWPWAGQFLTAPATAPRPKLC
jgi:hypothetical protein